MSRARYAGIIGALALVLWVVAAAGARPQDRREAIAVPDVAGRKVWPFARAARAYAFVFVRTDCPISNRYAPEIVELHRAFGGRGMLMWLVYPGGQSLDAIRRHRDEYGLDVVPALLDPRMRLVDLASARVTPEAAIFDASRQLVYRGRIDDRYIDIGRWRRVPTRHDARDALAALLAGRALPFTSQPAVGCFIDDLR
ncbi:MAG TPA: hypothetical protein VNI78_13455 [Vicinamibacterales bacterium]|nr:hypothetical protein [Vicinamibacterales bacterium]